MKKLLPYILPYLLLCGVTYAQEPTNIIDPNINDQQELLNMRKLDIRPGDVLPRLDMRYVLGTENYRWLKINSGSATINNLESATLVATSGTITALSVSSISIANLNTVFNIKVGTFSSKTTTGNQSITGVGFRPRAVIIMMGGGSTGDIAASLGLFSESSQALAFAVAARTGGTVSGEPPNTTTVVAYWDAGANTNRASYVSMDSDGFTLNWSIAGASAKQVTYLAIQ